MRMIQLAINELSLCFVLQLSTSQQNELNWLTEELPTRMKLIVSCSDDTATFQSIKSLFDQEAAYVPVSFQEFNAAR